MNIRDLKYFVSVAQFKNFGQAAKECAVSQPALSMQLKKLEDELGVQLFERSNKFVMLTAIGNNLLPKAQEIILLSEELKTSAKIFHDPFAGEFKLGAFPTLAPYYLPQIIPSITTNFPELKLFLFEEKTATLLEKLKEGALDAILIALPVNDQDLAYQTLFTEEFLLAVNKNHHLAKLKEITTSELNNEKLLLLDEGHCMRDQVLDLCTKIGAAEYMGFRATSLETLRQMVAANAGITLMPKMAINNNDPNIKYINFKGTKPAREIALVWRKTSAQIELVKKLIEILPINH